MLNEKEKVLNNAEATMENATASAASNRKLLLFAATGAVTQVQTVQVQRASIILLT
jgi:hypothetical protein